MSLSIVIALCFEVTNTITIFPHNQLNKLQWPSVGFNRLFPIHCVAI